MSTRAHLFLGIWALLVSACLCCSSAPQAVTESATDVPAARLVDGRYRSPRGEFTLKIPDLAESRTIRESTDPENEVLVIFEDESRLFLLKLWDNSTRGMTVDDHAATYRLNEHLRSKTFVETTRGRELRLTGIGVVGDPMPGSWGGIVEKYQLADAWSFFEYGDRVFLLTAGFKTQDPSGEEQKALMEAAGRALEQLLAGLSINFEKTTNWNLHAAAWRGDLQLARTLLASDASLADSKNETGNSPLHLAAVKGHADVLALLLEKGASVDGRNEQQELTALHLAAVENREVAAKLLIEHGADVNASARGQTPLSEAASSNSNDVLRVLLARGANIEGDPAEILTPLCYAARAGNVDGAKLLVANGADINGRVRGGSVFQQVLYTGRERRVDPETGATIDSERETHVVLAKFLLEKGARVNTGDLHMAARNGLTEIAGVILDHGVDPNQLDPGGRTPLHVAVEEGNEHLLAFLIKHGGAVDARDSGGRTPLMNAALWGHAPVAAVLINAGADVNAERDVENPTWEKTALEYAARKNHADVARLLIEAGADVNTEFHTSYFEDLPKSTLLEWAREKDHHEIIDLLVEKGVSLREDSDTPLERAIELGRTGEVKELIEDLDDLERRDSDGVSLLELAASSGHVDVVRLLLDRGASVEATDESGWSGLWGNAALGGVDVVKLLLDRGAMPEEKGPNVAQGLISAAISGEIQIMQLLLDAGVDVDIRDERGLTSLMHAAAYGWGGMDALHFLIDSGADVDAVSSDGQTALDLARESGANDDVIALLEGAAVKAGSAKGK